MINDKTIYWYFFEPLDDVYPRFVEEKYDEKCNKILQKLRNDALTGRDNTKSEAHLALLSRNKDEILAELKDDKRRIELIREYYVNNPKTAQLAKVLQTCVQKSADSMPPMDMLLKLVKPQAGQEEKCKKQIQQMAAVFGLCVAESEKYSILDEYIKNEKKPVFESLEEKLLSYKNGEYRNIYAFLSGYGQRNQTTAIDAKTPLRVLERRIADIRGMAVDDRTPQGTIAQEINRQAGDILLKKAEKEAYDKWLRNRQCAEILQKLYAEALVNEKEIESVTAEKIAKELYPLTGSQDEAEKLVKEYCKKQGFSYVKKVVDTGTKEQQNAAEANRLYGEAEAYILRLKFAAARENIEKAYKLNNNRAMRNRMLSMMEARQEKAEQLRKDLEQVMAKKAFMQAQNIYDKMTRELHPYKDESIRLQIATARQQAGKYVAEAEKAKDEAAKYDLLERALACCGDYEPALRLQAGRLPQPRGFKVESDAGRKRHIISWRNDLPFEYVLVRSTQPITDLQDGRVIWKGENGSSYEDTEVKCGERVYYNLFLRRGREVSIGAEVSGIEVLSLWEIPVIHVESLNKCLHLEWDKLPENVSVQIYTLTNDGEEWDGEANSKVNCYNVRHLENGKECWLKIKLEYHINGKKYLTAGKLIKGVPKSLPIPQITMKTAENGKIRLELANMQDPVPQGFQLYYRHDQYPSSNDDSVAVNLYIPYTQYAHDGAIMIPDLKEQDYYINIYAVYGESKYADKSDKCQVLFSNKAKSRIQYTIDVRKSMIIFGQPSTVVMRFVQAGREEWQMPAVEIRGSAGNMPMRSTDGEEIYHIDEQQVKGELNVEFKIPAWLKRNGFIKAYTADKQVKLELDAESTYSIT